MHPAAIGPFKIDRELGRGGMGEVFLATDTRLDRQVAIKALPAHLSQDPDRLIRFQREAKLLASLNHPNIAAIYGLEELADNKYLILEYVEGVTLADRLNDGPIPIDEALSFARQIAEALEVAHDKGIVHRDLKPANVIVTPDGVLKVLDFGLARTAEGALSSTNVTAKADSPTLPTPVRHSPTIPGAIMGTAGYMSPEQARGKTVDKRSDIFSFGCVLYEMLTGAMPFPGETVTDSIGAILHREPTWELLPAATPPRVRELLTTCMAKDRRSRLHDIGDARLALERTISGKEWTHSPTAVATSSPSPLRWIFGAAAAISLLAGGWLLGRTLHTPTPPPKSQPFHVSTTVPAKPGLSSISGIAPDASFVVYTAWQQMQAESTKPEGVMVVRRLDRDEFKVIDATEGAMEGALSPDGRWLAFIAAKDRARSRITLKKIALDDGRPVGNAETLCDLPAGGYYQLCWSSDREIALSAGWQRTILAVPASGGEPRVVLSEEKVRDIDIFGEVRPLIPGKSILVTRWALVGQGIEERIEVLDLASGKLTPLLTNAGGAHVISSSAGIATIVARRNQDSLIAVKLDTTSMQIVGEPVTVAAGGGARSLFFVSQNGTLARSSTVGDMSSRRLLWIDEAGQSQPIAAPTRAYGSISISPDGTRFATYFEPANESDLPTEIWIYNLARRTFTRIPTLEPTFTELCWSPDGQQIAYSTITNKEASIWMRRTDGTGEPTKLYSNATGQTLLVPQNWSPDGKILAILQVNLASNTTDILMLEQETAAAQWTATPYLSSPTTEELLAFSPDAKWVTFVSDESGRRELYLQRFSGPKSADADNKAGRTQISNSGTMGGAWWSRDGKELRYIDTDSQVQSVQLQTQPTLTVSLPKPLYSIKEFEFRLATTAPDGRMMLVIKGESERATKIDLLVNFTDEVNARMTSVKLPGAK
jgi:serine/threonine-protein kinase